jgi:dTDP-4-amino-4,6-dideoxygalactose transaminase
MAEPTIRFQNPSFPSADAIERYLRLSREAHWYSNFGPCAELLRERLTDTTGRPCVVVANATVGLMVAIAAVRGPEREPREALVPSFAFAASAQSAVWNGLRPVFVDVSPEHWHLDPDALDAALEAHSGRVAVVIALSSLGVPPPPGVRRRWQEICARAEVPLVVDSAAGYGAIAEDGVAIGGQGDAEVVSFHALKPVSAGEGGAVFCRDEETADVVRQLVNFTFDAEHQALRPDGMNAKLSEPAAAVALASLDELPTSLARRREHAEAIAVRLPRGFDLQAGHERGTWQFFPVTAPDTATRERILAEGRRREIGLRTYYDPLHLMPAFASYELAGELTATSGLTRRMLSLPMAVELEPDEIDRIVDLVEAGVAAEVRS